VTTLTSINDAFMLHIRVCKLCGNLDGPEVCAIGAKLLSRFHAVILDEARREALGLIPRERKPRANVLTM